MPTAQLNIVLVIVCTRVAVHTYSSDPVRLTCVQIGRIVTPHCQRIRNTSCAEWMYVTEMSGLGIAGRDAALVTASYLGNIVNIGEESSPAIQLP